MSEGKSFGFQEFRKNVHLKIPFTDLCSSVEKGVFLQPNSKRRRQHSNGNVSVFFLRLNALFQVFVYHFAPSAGP